MTASPADRSDEQVEADLAALEFRRLNPGNVAGEDWTRIAARLLRDVPSLLARAQKAEAEAVERLRQFNAAKDQRDAALAGDTRTMPCPTGCERPETGE